MRTTPMLVPVLVLAAACGASTPDAKDPAPAASASAAPSAEPAVTAAAPTAAPAKPSADVDGPDGIRRIAVWEGPKAGKPVTGKKVWVLAPNTMGGDKLSFSSVSLRLVDLDKSDGNELVFKDRNVRYAVPAALAWAAEPARGLKKGGLVRCSFGGNTTVARVDAVDARSVTCAFRFMERTKKEKMPLDEVRAMSGKLEPGAPAFVSFEGESERYHGVVVTAAGDDAWVTVDTQFSDGPRAGRAVHKVKVSNVQIIDMSKPLKAGDACVAQGLGGVQPCKVAAVVDGGLGYTVSFEGGGAPREMGLDEVAPAPKGGKK